MELPRLEIEDIEHMAKIFACELEDELSVEGDLKLDVVRIFEDTLKRCLFEETELLEQARLEGETDAWR